ncbi:MAG: hypothetical protein EOO36_06440 [Cytophagaceae bacterium]|nr:MAG: hypothetical protein EOO36_06440 [Cytophagaceae bacterium]
MLSRSLLLAAALVFGLSAAQAQPASVPATHYRASELLRAGLAQPAGPAPLRALLIPTVQAAAAYALPAKATSRPLPADTLPAAPRHDLTGVWAAPPYDLYQNLPEEFRKRTLPVPWVEPLPLQLLRGALGR